MTLGERSVTDATQGPHIPERSCHRLLANWALYTHLEVGESYLLQGKAIFHRWLPEPLLGHRISCPIPTVTPAVTG